MALSIIGDSPKRREDLRFVTGRGAYLDDLRFDGLAQAAVLRSPYAHASIRSIDVSAATRAPGVLAVLTAADAHADGLKPLRPYVEANVQTGEPFAFALQPLLAADKVRFAGEPVALVVAETLAQALDATESIIVDYVPLPAVTTAGAACAPGAPQISAEVPGNRCLDWRTGDWAGVEAAFERAAHLVQLRLDNHRVVTNPMEPRGCVGQFDPASARYTLHVSSQNIHANRNHVARCLGVEPKDVRFVAPDVGGGFGAKNFAYAEQALVLWAARRIGRPVKWVASRSEVFLSDHAGRDVQAEATLALDASGRFLALKVESFANLGAYMAGAGGGVQTYQYVHLQGTVYRIPAIALHIVAALSNTAPIGVTRGPGFAETVNIVERLIDAAALQGGFDRFELRRRNIVPAHEMPMINSFGFQIDSGAFGDTLDKALARADLAGFADRRRESERRGLLRGLGVAYHIKGTGGSPEENVDIRFESDGTVALVTGTQHIGQGHETTFPQILAHRLGIPNELIRLRQGDTDLIATGGGHGSSRATYMGGTAIWRAADAIIAKGLALAAEALEAAEADIRFENGRFTVSGTDRGTALLDVAVLGRKKNRPLDTYHFWKREHLTFPNGAHVAEIEIDRDTGAVDLVRYTAVDDYGVMVNPMIVQGQAHGAMAQGIGQALMEHAAYDPISGQMIAASFMDYALPRAAHLPAFDLGFNPTSCITNPLGVKGCGEAGAIAAFPAIVNAVLDALRPLGVTHFDGPATPLRVWQAIAAAQG
ncbi:xanthine dehydrogenase family protein molybdopterin-binding subunit [Enhydrobacter sp.]|jgi:carbon-monoxide dehydrogenase large subunit|uniref:xanthine dehydrogenase family protein molybdopterin-binding subunit n=1 Tax=Enhydrobacter sp. TaxID=1894999 RepID=UPI00261C2924|nr:xanthine dehydrogenase family protein molybdopterin-binding subunit [Enhydrobacter sp.]WIM10548.1 MAG: Aerobic carbon monoxide dehydrogenase (quinone), large chain [Enhydrobacter sp.]